MGSRYAVRYLSGTFPAGDLQLPHSYSAQGSQPRPYFIGIDSCTAARLTRSRCADTRRSRVGSTPRRSQSACSALQQPQPCYSRFAVAIPKWLLAHPVQGSFRNTGPAQFPCRRRASLASAGVILRAVTPKAILCIFAGHRWVIEPNHDAVTRLSCRRCGNSRVESGEMRGITGYGRSTQRGVRR
jgi:hypothetical protein